MAQVHINSINHILTPRQLLVGGGSLAQLPQVLAQSGVRRPLLVVDPALVRLGVCARVQALLEQAGMACAVFSEVVADPDDISVELAADAVRAGQHDGLIGLGGGSALDTAKAAAVLASLRQPLRTLKVPRIVDEAVLPVIAIPTTAGTGSEVTRACVITDAASHEKMLMLGMGCLPAAAIVDFELTLSCPFRVSADTGLDALTHALEALVNRNGNPHAEALALSALRLIGANLQTVCFEPGNRAARAAMMLGATHAGLAVSNTSTALIHGMSRPLGAFFHVPHGLSNAMLLRVVTQFSAPAAPQAYAAAARALGWAQVAASDEQAITALLDGFGRLLQTLQVPTPAAFGINKQRWFALRGTMAQQALQSGTPANNPRLASADDIVALYTAAWQD